MSWIDRIFDLLADGSLMKRSSSWKVGTSKGKDWSAPKPRDPGAETEAPASGERPERPAS